MITRIILSAIISIVHISVILGQTNENLIQSLSDYKKLTKKNIISDISLPDSITSLFPSNFSIKLTKRKIFYDTNLNMIEIQNENWTDSTHFNSKSRIISNYSVSNKLLSKSTQTYNSINKVWNEAHIIESYEYDPAGKVISFTTPNEKDVYKYDKNERLDSTLVYYGNIKSKIYKYYYSGISSNADSSDYYGNMWGTGLVLAERYYNKYDQNNNLSEVTVKKTTLDGFFYSNRYSYLYNIWNRDITSIESFWSTDSMKWFNQVRYTYDKDSLGTNLNFLKEYKVFNADWFISEGKYLYDISYNITGQPKEIQTKSLHNGIEFPDVYPVNIYYTQNNYFNLSGYKIFIYYSDHKVNTGVIELNNSDEIKDFSLSQNYPNPFNPSTTLSFTIPNSEQIELDIFNLLGQKLETVYSGFLQSGKHDFPFNGSRLPSGIYFAKLKSGSGEKTIKMTLMK